MGWGRRLLNGSESLLSVIYLVFNSFQPRTKHFYQTVFCGNRITTGLFQQRVKKRTRHGNNSISGRRRMRRPAERSRLEPGLSTYSTALTAESGSPVAAIHLLVLSTRVNEVHLIQRQGPIRLRDRPKKINYKLIIPQM